jgi:hypothetical protein
MKNKKMSGILYLLIILIGVTAIIGIIGLLLPRERTETRQSVLNAPPQKVYEIVTNNNDWQYRSDLNDLKIIETSDRSEVWEETDKKGNIIRFKTKEKVPYSFYSFEMENNLFSGYWTGTFEETKTGSTLFTATEHVSMKNPFMKTLSYLFFDIGKFMETYQLDLKNKIEAIYKPQ